MLSKKDIEELATGAVRRYFNTCSSISPQIQENDKTPDWDGELFLYNGKKDIRKNFLGSLRIQVKGKEVSKFKDKETFPVETIFLNNARNEGFVFFVVEVMANGNSKIFYKNMAPIEIRGELASISQKQKTRSMWFEPLSDDKAWIEIQLKGFLSDCLKQKSFASKKEFCIENIKDASDYQWGFSFQGKKNELLNDFLGGFKSFLYVKNKDGIEIPVGNGKMNFIVPELSVIEDKDVYIGDEAVASKYIVTCTKDSVSYDIEGIILLKLERSMSNSKQTSTLEILANTTNEQITAYKIFKQMVEYGSIKLGKSEITVEISDKETFISKVEKRLKHLTIHKSVLDVLNIRTPINYKSFTEEDNYSLKQLYKALIEHKSIGLTNPKELFKLGIANINVLLVCQDDGNGKYYLDNAFESSMIKVTQNSDEMPFQVPIFSFLEQKGYVEFDNIPFENITEAYKKYSSIDSRVVTQANLDLLQMLKAYDELKRNGSLEKSKHLLEATQSLAKWLLDNDSDASMIAVHQLNYLQIIKRQREYTEKELYLLRQLSKNSSEMVRAGAFLLLDKREIFQYIFSMFSADEKERFMDFPIAIYAKETSI